ncbi:MAG TPA: molybdate ABC transporter substrate-binding protein [Verrucomicrobiae bacterium]|jgi:molybdate transport system substrate-binding protein|nr:molybdate ABC transporter substrate-binding protein [Verrucomicrobiae bacterium]
MGFLFGLCFFIESARGADLIVYAAASLTDALQEIGGGYEKPSSDHVRFNLGASSLLARQIQEGAPGDIFVSADEEKMDQLERRKLILTDSRVNLLSNALVVVVSNEAAPSLKSASDLLKCRRIALAEPSTVPAGIYAREYLTHLRLWDKLRERVVPTENVRAALAAVESGNVDAGIVYKTDAAISKKVKVAFEVRGEGAPKILYPAAVLSGSKQRDAAGKFLEYLRAPEAKAVFEKFGFVVLSH